MKIPYIGSDKVWKGQAVVWKKEDTLLYINYFRNSEIKGVLFEILEKEDGLFLEFSELKEEIPTNDLEKVGDFENIVVLGEAEEDVKSLLVLADKQRMASIYEYEIIIRYSAINWEYYPE